MNKYDREILGDRMSIFSVSKDTSNETEVSNSIHDLEKEVPKREVKPKPLEEVKPVPNIRLEDDSDDDDFFDDFFDN